MSCNCKRVPTDGVGHHWFDARVALDDAFLTGNATIWVQPPELLLDVGDANQALMTVFGRVVQPGATAPDIHLLVERSEDGDANNDRFESVTSVALGVGADLMTVAIGRDSPTLLEAGGLLRIGLENRAVTTDSVGYVEIRVWIALSRYDRQVSVPRGMRVMSRRTLS